MKEMTGIQCRNVIYLEPPKDCEFDLHLVKYTEYFNDGSKEPKIKLVKDFKKTFWVCNTRNRLHKQKKERYPLDQCEEIKSSRMNMLNDCKRALGIKFGNPLPQDILRGPYTYGTDLSSSAELKYKFNQQALAKKTEKAADVAAFDVETNIRDESRYEFIEMATLSFKDIVITVVDKFFFTEKSPNLTKELILDKLYQYDEIYLGKINRERNIKQEFYVVDSEIEVLQTLFKRAHELKPDFICAWNMDYDITRSIAACKRANIDPKEIFCDPSIPEDFKFFNYNPGRENSMSKKGVWKNFANFERWPQVNVPASFTFIDSMCLYYGNRKHLGKESSYKLEYILAKEFPNREDIRKLKFDEVAHLENTPDWHIQMQSKYPYEYVIYNKFDCIALEILDEQTMDIALSLVSACATGDYQDYESEPKRLANQMHWFNLERGYAYGTGGKNSELPFDSKLIGRNGWIITLRADLYNEPGLNKMSDAPDLWTNIHEDNGDIDVTSSYPNGNAALNTSVETMTKELISIEDVDEIDRRQCGINMAAGFINSVEISNKLFGLPEMTTMLEYYRKK